jgi:hypothetical protein
MHVSQLDAADAFVTLDGSTIRELAGRVSLPAENRSLAQARAQPLTLPCCCAPPYRNDDIVPTGG